MTKLYVFFFYIIIIYINITDQMSILEILTKDIFYITWISFIEHFVYEYNSVFYENGIYLPTTYLNMIFHISNKEYVNQLVFYLNIFS